MSRRVEDQPTLARECVSDRDKMRYRADYEVMHIFMKAVVDYAKCKICKRRIPDSNDQISNLFLIAPDVAQHGLLVVDVINWWRNVKIDALLFRH